jgi:hypothetical protein
LIETLYQMTISFHRRGRDEKTDRAFDALHKALDELKMMEEKEFGVSEEEMEEEDDAASVESQSHEEEGASIRKLEAGEEADTEALRKQDEMAMDRTSYSAEHMTEVSSYVFEGTFWTVSQLTHVM